ncbi:hypothetical protein [Mesorhizobium sp. B2-6-1]|uniref:hypothetical protein n=1 Tax=Mesorhizobium sp. B2-6-1 TaxID=2589916 RepID=UPI00112B9068|nr:hypothetical protein [Mesorhizobium sp. B2-6-1]TPJ59958.1 hypothetical protein FJ443_22460 [Mesorhizobium sp. B2-6-1]
MITERAAAILGVAIIGAVGLYLYFSPYQQCVREQSSSKASGTGGNGLLSDEDFGIVTPPRSQSPAAKCLAMMGRK